MNYVNALYDLFAWQGGTVHQVAEELGIDVTSLLYGKPGEMRICSDSDWMKGQYAFSTCSREFILENLKEKYKGNIDFWLGYMRAAYLESLNK